MFVLRSVLLSCAVLSAAPLAAQTPSPTTDGGLAYADVADLALIAPVIVDATITDATRIKGAEAAGVAPGLTRFYVEADVNALIRGTGGQPPQIGYVIDLAPDSAGRLPRLKKARVLVFARPVATDPGQLQLVAPDAEVGWTPAIGARTLAIASAAAAADAPPIVTGVGNAFHVPGSLPGEGETQVFLVTADRRPVSLTVLRRPGEQPRWAVALSEIVDEAAAPPPRDTLLWYRLACVLPAALPEHSTASLAPADADQARIDYRFVIDSLGPCERTRRGR